MIKIYIKLIKKIIILFIITALPLGGYLYLSKYAQTTLMSNVDDKINKYIVEAEINMELKTIFMNEKILLRNNTRDSLEKVYINTNLKNTEIISTYINGEQSNFKPINQGDGLLLLLPSKPMLVGEEVSIDIECKVDLGELLKNRDIEEYTVENWYPTLASKTSKGWNIDGGKPKEVKGIKSNHIIKTIIGSSHSITTNGNVDKVEALDNDRNVYYIQDFKEENIVLIIRNK